ncbi:MAG: hypothetical protein ABSD89_09610 [Halobacteriota archaeon]
MPSLIAGRRREFESYQEHHSRSEGRNCEIESGAPVVGGFKYNREESSTKEPGTTDTQNLSGRQEKNRSGTAGTLGEDQGSKEGVVRHLEISGATALRIAAWNLIRAAKPPWVPSIAVSEAAWERPTASDFCFPAILEEGDRRPCLTLAASVNARLCHPVLDVLRQGRDPIGPPVR